ncbi:MAG TPA: thiamine-phosphate kinase, partial [Pyrinomonadaceae bacterium]|nr:thiamine-phosphate kinase [Pyrinomonadaceae bacterium]
MKGEFDFIHYIKKSFGLAAIGDDCAVLPKDDDFDLLVTADLLVEDIDFRLNWTKPEFLGHKALAVSLSDIAAMGGEPRWAMLAIAVPEKLWETDFVKRFYEGWTGLASEFQVNLVGGDISRSADKFLVDSIVGGEAPKGAAILRSGAKPGDGIFVSGRLGGAAGGLRLLEKIADREPSEMWQKSLITRQLKPMPRVELAKYLRESSLASSMIDLSDGLSSDIYHICEESGVGAEIDASLLPIDENLKIFAGSDEQLALAINGGEDFELLFTVAQEKISLLKNCDVTRIGTVT